MGLGPPPAVSSLFVVLSLWSGGTGLHCPGPQASYCCPQLNAGCLLFTKLDSERGVMWERYQKDCGSRK